MSGQWLSRAAILWAFDEAPDVPARLVSTLLAVARYADKEGRGAYPSAATVAGMTRKSETQAKRDIAELARLGLLVPGDRRITRDIRADRRPNIYDLPMARGAPECTPSGRSRGASGDGTGCIPLQNGVRPDAPKEVHKTSGSGAARDRAEGADALTPKPLHLAPPCPECGKPFSQEQLADPGFRALALDGDALHSECREADTLRYLRTASIRQLIEDGSVDEAIRAGTRKAAEFPAGVLTDDAWSFAGKGAPFMPITGTGAP